MPRRTSRARRLSAVGVLTLFLGVIGCGADAEEPTAGPSSEEGLAAARELATALEGQAEELRAAFLAPKDYAKAAQMMTAARADEGAERPDRARRKYNVAARKFRQTIEAATRNLERLATEKGRLKEYEELRQKARELQAPELAREYWESAEADARKARALLNEGKVGRARMPLTRALMDIQSSMERCHRELERKGEVETQRAEVVALDQAATQGNFARLAPREIQDARAEMSRAVKAFENHHFEAALAHLETAKGQFTLAAKVVQQQRALSRQNRISSLLGNRTTRPAGNPGVVANVSTPPLVVKEIPVPPEEEDHPIDLARLTTLFGAVPEYQKGILSLSYDSGSTFRQDIEIKGRSGDRFMHFEGSDFVGFGVEEYVIAGNTNGFILLDAVFEDGAQVEMDVQFQLILPDQPEFQVLLMAENAQSGYASNFGTDLVIYEHKRTPKRFPSLHDEYRTHPTRWLGKRDPVAIKMKYRKASDQKGILQVWFDGDETCRVRTDRYRTGNVGLRWRNVKFYVKSLTVKGYLDEEWAAGALAEAPASETPAGDEDF